MQPYLFIGLTLVLATYSQLVVKSRALEFSSHAAGDKLRYLISMFTDIFALSGFAAVVLGGIFWVLAMEKVNLAYAYPIMSLSFVLVPLASSALFGEPLSNLQLAGLGVIVIGVSMSALAQ